MLPLQNSHFCNNEDSLSENTVVNTSLKQWTTTDPKNQCTIHWILTDSFTEKLPALQTHISVATRLALYLNELKFDLKLCKVIALSDSTESNTFLLQYNKQCFHWNNVQAAVQPFTVYLREQFKDVLPLISSFQTVWNMILMLFTTFWDTYHSVKQERRYFISHIGHLCQWYSTFFPP